MPNPFPWFIYPLFILGLALLVHYCHIYCSQRPYIIHIMAYIILNSLLAVTWYLTPIAYPWFLWIMGVWGLAFIVAALVFYLKGKGAFHKLNYKPVELPEPVNVTIDIPPPSYEVKTVSPGNMSSFPSLPDVVKFSSMPNIIVEENEPLLKPSEKLQRQYNTTKY